MNKHRVNIELKRSTNKHNKNTAKTQTQAKSNTQKHGIYNKTNTKSMKHTQHKNKKQ